MVTISEVARHAGVAVSTVSYVLSGKRAISADTRRRVLDSVRSLGYHPNAGARALASKRSNVIALVLPLRAGMHVPVLMQFATSVVTAARQYDHDVLLLTADEGSDGLRRAAASSLVDGAGADGRGAPRQQGAAAPGARRAQRADRLPRRLGRTDLRRPGLRAGRARSAWSTWPNAGTGRSRCSAPPRWSTSGAPASPAGRGRGSPRPWPARPDRGRAAVRGDLRPGVRATIGELLDARPGLSGLVVHNEAAVNHVLGALRQYGRRVPGDIAVVAICPDDIAERSSPALTSVLIPAEEVGRQAVRLLMEKLEGRAVPEAPCSSPG